jgi:hypothetical protein
VVANDIIESIKYRKQENKQINKVKNGKENARVKCDITKNGSPQVKVLPGNH